MLFHKSPPCRFYLVRYQVMAASEPRFGRKRALPSCPNPLFLQWLTELRDEAKEKGLKTQYTYQKVKMLTLFLRIMF